MRVRKHQYLKLTAVLVVILLGVGTVILLRDNTVPKPIPMNPVYLDSTQSTEVRISDLLSHMTMAEKIGQLALVEKNSLLAPEDIARYHLGGLLSGSGSKPEDNSTAGWQAMIAEYQAQAQASRLRIPLLYGTDAVHGHAHVSGMTIFPHMIALGATRNPELVRDIARATAVDMTRTGANWNYAPNLDQPRDIRWGRVYEAFSDDPNLVAALGTAYLEGLQNADTNQTTPIAVLATPKHYLGIGSSVWGSSMNKNFQIDQGVVLADEAALRAEYLPPFAAAVGAGALSIMVGLHAWGDERVIRQEYLLTDVLKGELGFSGFLVSDWYGVYEGKRSTFLASVQAINAGVDMVMLPFDYKTFVRNVTWANRLGLISDERIDDAVRRILRAKFELGLFDTPTQIIESETIDAEHRALAREAVAESVVLLKNNDDLLPLSSNIGHIRVAGGSADNVGRQLGAWSLEWQGVEGNWPDNTISILAGIKNAVSPNTRVEYSLDGTFVDTQKADVGIAIVGEKPYAEGWGDTAFPILDEADLTAIKNLQAFSDQVVVIIVAGRPLLIEREVDSFDALMMAWLPGSAGDGVADVLFGKKSFAGRLPLPWPMRAEQLPISVTGETTDGTEVLYSRYFGLTPAGN
jgi:beta-glucosidase